MKKKFSKKNNGYKPLTKVELKEALKPMATKAELKEALKPMVTKAELKEALKPMATKAELKEALKPMVTKHDFQEFQEEVRNKFASHDRQFEAISERFDETDRRIEEILVEARKHRDDILTAVDTFMKRGEENDLGILFLGRQHDRLRGKHDHLEKFCQRKMHYTPINPA